MTKIRRKQALRLIDKSAGKFFSVLFKKKDGSLRPMLCRKGVTKGVKGVGMSYTPSRYGLIPVYDVQKQEFRMVNLNTLQSIKIGGESYQIIGNE